MELKEEGGGAHYHMNSFTRTLILTQAKDSSKLDKTSDKSDQQQPSLILAGLAVIGPKLQWVGS